jgi:hypothetical protein
VDALTPTKALSNSDSYSMFLLLRRAPLAISRDDLPPADPAPTGFASAADAGRVQDAVALAQAWARLAAMALEDLYLGILRLGTNRPVPASFGSARLDEILLEVRRRFSPILSGPPCAAIPACRRSGFPQDDGPIITQDDLTMLAGVRDRFHQIELLFKEPIVLRAGTPTSAAVRPAAPPATTPTLTLTVDSATLSADDVHRARVLIDAILASLPSARVPVALRPQYGAFAEFARNKHQ